MAAEGLLHEEARVRLARLCEAAGEHQRARELYVDVVRRLSSASPGYRREQREWLLFARERLKQRAS
jgi:hypothetical protein